MAKDIYNEGRVVGLSAYELYLRHFQSDVSQPESAQPADEASWLAASLGSGAALILQIPENTEGIYTVPLPENSRLCGASTIAASFFDGECEFDTTGWATCVNSYGSLLKYDSNSYPDKDATDIRSDSDWDYENSRTQMMNYLKLSEGLAYQPGEWADNSKNINYIPNLNLQGYVRIRITEKLTSPVNILLVGWLDKTVLSPVCHKDEGHMHYTDSKNGDFLGPEAYPWASKIIFTTSNNILNTFLTNSYERNMTPQEKGLEEYVTSQPIIDYQYAPPKSFYSKQYTNSYHTMKVTELHPYGDSENVLATVSPQQKTTSSVKLYPPAIYGTNVTETGVQNLYPLDIAAPGTVKAFDNLTDAKLYPHAVPYGYGLYVDPDGEGPIKLYSPTGQVDIITELPDNAGVSINKVMSDINYPEHGFYYTADVSIGNKKVRAIDLTNPDAPSELLPLDGSGGTVHSQRGGGLTDDDWWTDDILNWHKLLALLGPNRGWDILGEALSEFKKNSWADNQNNIVWSKAKVIFQKQEQMGGLPSSLMIDPQADTVTANNLITTNHKAATYTLVSKDGQTQVDTNLSANLHTSDAWMKFANPLVVQSHIKLRGWTYTDEGWKGKERCLFVQKAEPTDAHFKKFFKDAGINNDSNIDKGIPSGSIWIKTGED